jgi:hypothetical protein
MAVPADLSDMIDVIALGFVTTYGMDNIGSILMGTYQSFGSKVAPCRSSSVPSPPSRITTPASVHSREVRHSSLYQLRDYLMLSLTVSTEANQKQLITYPVIAGRARAANRPVPETCFRASFCSAYH